MRAREPPGLPQEAGLGSVSAQIFVSHLNAFCGQQAGLQRGLGSGQTKPGSCTHSRELWDRNWPQRASMLPTASCRAQGSFCPRPEPRFCGRVVVACRLAVTSCWARGWGPPRGPALSVGEGARTFPLPAHSPGLGRRETLSLPSWVMPISQTWKLRPGCRLGFQGGSGTEQDSREGHTPLSGMGLVPFLPLPLLWSLRGQWG